MRADAGIMPPIRGRRTDPTTPGDRSPAGRRLMAETGPASRPVLVLDFGSQFVQLIARRVRERHAFARIVRHDITVERIRELDPLAIILSGGPSSVYEAGAPHCDPQIFRLGIPVLAICYGMQ